MKSPIFDARFARGQLTADQLVVLRQIKDLAVLYFTDVAQRCAIEPRLWPLIVGPTGCGKSFLARQLAGYMGAHYLHITYGDWIVQGAKGTCTQFAILNALARNSRVVVHLDELDKLPARGDQEWSRAVVNEVWSLLDHELPFERFVQDAGAQGQHDDETLDMLMVEKGHGRMFIVGSGTWQDVFDGMSDRRGPIGFARSQSALCDFESAIPQVTQVGGPMSELLARFYGAVQLIRPPQLHEALRLLERAGARDFARQIGFDEERSLRELLPRQGFRALQSVVTELMLKGWRPARDGQLEQTADAQTNRRMGPE